MPYLDYNATTPVDGHALAAMTRALKLTFGNPSSAHRSGSEAAELVEKARQKVAKAVGMKASDVIFTSGATEANNLALSGLRAGLKRPIWIIVGATEHKSVLTTCEVLAAGGSVLNVAPVNGSGTINIMTLERSISGGIDVVSIMAANSETGVIHPIREAAELAHKHGALFHCDATQALGKIPLDADELGIDMLTISAHKIYGPKGSGALVASREARRRIAPIIHGGGQERDLRSGTQNVPAIVGFGEACRIAVTKGLADAPRQCRLRDSFEESLDCAVSGVSVNGYETSRLPNTSSVRIRGTLADAVVSRLPSVEISTGSACSSAAMEPSHVLVAMGLGREGADESIRVSVGRQTTDADIKTAVEEVAEAVSYVRGVEAGRNIRGRM